MASSQEDLAAKLAETLFDGTLIHGTTIQTYKMDTEVSIEVVDKANFRCIVWCAQPINAYRSHTDPCIRMRPHMLCSVCFVCGRSPASAKPSRACGNAYNNLLKHMGSKAHFKHFKLQANDVFSKEEWRQYTAGNQHGPARRAQKFANRKAQRDRADLQKRQAAAGPQAVTEEPCGLAPAEDLTAEPAAASPAMLAEAALRALTAAAMHESAPVVMAPGCGGAWVWVPGLVVELGPPGAYAVPAFPMEVPFAVEMEEVLEAVHVV
jgi:hypothetical protein